MNIYIDESGSINNHSSYEKHFVIALIRVIDKRAVEKTYKRFVSKNLERLKALDVDKINNDGEIVRAGGKMFQGDKFIELKGTQFDREMKTKFVESFVKKGGLEVYYIKLDNSKLTDGLCSDISTAFNYPLKMALEYFINKGYLPKESCTLQLDERNEKTDKKYFLEQYINTEFTAKNVTSEKVLVKYFDSADNKFIQIADIFANLYYSQLKTNAYSNEIGELRKAGILKFIFKFPLS